MSDPTDPLVAELDFTLLGPGRPAITIEPPEPGTPAPHEVAITVRGLSVEQVGVYLGFLSRCIAKGVEDGLPDAQPIDEDQPL